MELKYYHSINNVEYYNLDKWFKTFVRQHSWALNQGEIKLIERIDCLKRGVITVRVDNNLNVCMNLYLSEKCIDKQIFEPINMQGIGEKLTKMMLRLKKNNFEE